MHGSNKFGYWNVNLNLEIKQSGLVKSSDVEIVLMGLLKSQLWCTDTLNSLLFVDVCKLIHSHLPLSLCIFEFLQLTLLLVVKLPQFLEYKQWITSTKVCKYTIYVTGNLCNQTLRIMTEHFNHFAKLYLYLFLYSVQSPCTTGLKALHDPSDCTFKNSTTLKLLTSP